MKNPSNSISSGPCAMALAGLLMVAAQASLANVNTSACGRRSDNPQAYDFCMQQTGGSPSNPVTNGSGGWHSELDPPARDPIKPYTPGKWPPPPSKIPGASSADDNSQYGSGGFAPPRVPKPNAGDKACQAALQKCAKNAACVARAQQACDARRP